MHFLLSRFSGVALATVSITRPDINGVFDPILDSQSSLSDPGGSEKTNGCAPDCYQRPWENRFWIERAELCARPTPFPPCDGRSNSDLLYPPSGSQQCDGSRLLGRRRGRGRACRRPNRARIGFCGHSGWSARVVCTRQNGEVLRESLRLS